MIQYFRTVAIAALVAFCGLGQAAEVFSSNFNHAGSGGSGGYYYFSFHSATQVFDSTGVTEVDRMTLTLHLFDNMNYATQDLGLSFALNGMDVGTTVYAAGVDDDKNLDFSFAKLTSTSGTWVLSMSVYMPVCSGCGAVQMSSDNPFTLYAPVGSTVPEPATLALAGVALLGIGLSRRRAA